MICKDKFSNLYVSYETMGGHHLKAFFGMHVGCAMNEVLKFPGFFEISELADYLGSIKIISKARNLGKTIRHTENFFGDVYRAENKAITPIVLPLQGVEDDMVYFFFEQHFDGHQNNPPYMKRKYKLEIGVIDLSVQKAMAARERIIEFIQTIENISDPSRLGMLEEQMVEAVSLGIKIQQKTSDIYRRAMSLDYTRDFKFINELVDEFKRDIKYMNNRIKFHARLPITTKAARPDYGGPNPYNILEKEFKQEIDFNFKSEYQNLSQIQKLPSLPTISIDNVLNSQIQFQKTIQTKAKILDEIPNFETNYSKKTSFEQKQTLEQKAENYSLNFVDAPDSKKKQEIGLVSAATNLPIYVLLGHSGEVVTVPNFVLLSNYRGVLSSGSNYLCRTSMVESENQYFILET